MKSTAINLLLFPALRGACLRVADVRLTGSCSCSDMQATKSTRSKRAEMDAQIKAEKEAKIAKKEAKIAKKEAKIAEVVKAYHKADDFAKKTEGRKVVRQKPPAGTEYQPAKDGEDAMLVLSFGDRGQLEWSKSEKSGEWKLFDYERIIDSDKRNVVELLKILREEVKKEAKCLTLNFEPNDDVIQEMVKFFSEADGFVKGQKDKHSLLVLSETDKLVESGLAREPWVVAYWPRQPYIDIDFDFDDRVLLSFRPYGVLRWSKKSGGEWEFNSNDLDDQARKLWAILWPKVKKAKYLRLPNPKK